MNEHDLIARLTAERDEAREEAGVYKHRMEEYKEKFESYRDLCIRLNREARKRNKETSRDQ